MDPDAPASDDEITATPLLKLDAVIELMTDAVSVQDIPAEAKKVKSGMELVFPCEAYVFDQAYVSDEQIVKVTRDAKVTCASGESDAESIRDQESGPGKFRWHRRDPYWYRREPCLDNCKNFRRMMKFSVEPAEGEGHFAWIPLVDSDDDGEVKQPSFVLSSTIATDAEGYAQGTHKHLQPVDSKYDNATTKADEEWRKVFGKGFEASLAIKDAVPELTDDTIDVAMLGDLLSQFVMDQEERSIGYAVDELLEAMRWGMSKRAIGAARGTDVCGRCFEPLFDEGTENVELQICPVCNRWIHEYCYEFHMGVHVPGILCLGVRRNAAACPPQGAKCMRCRKLLADSSTYCMTCRQIMGFPARELESELDEPAAASDAQASERLQREGTSQARAPSAQPAAAAGSSGPLDEFFQSRAPFTLSRKNKVRKYARGDSSEEEGLPEVDYCTQCGSMECNRQPSLCAEQDRLNRAKHLCRGLCDHPPFACTVTELFTSDHVDQMENEIGARVNRVAERDALKAPARQRSKEFREGRRELDVESMMAKGTTYAWEPFARTISQTALNTGLKSGALKRMVDTALKRGRAFTHGSTADMILWSSMTHTLNRAIHLWRSGGLQHKAKEFVNEFLSKVTKEHFSQISWAMKVCRIILLTETEFAVKASEPGIEEPEAGPSDPVAAAASTLKKAWQTKDFTLTLAKVQSGEVKLTLWSVNDKYRREHHARLQRLRQIYGVGAAEATGQRTDASARVSREVIGLAGVAGIGNLQRLAQAEAVPLDLLTPEQVKKPELVDHEEFMELSGPELRKAEAAMRKREKELLLKDKDVLNELYVAGSWWCWRCNNVLGPDQTDCPNYVKKQRKDAKYGSACFQLCRGSQRETWGGYVRGADVKPTLSRRELYPALRASPFSGGSRSAREKAKVKLTEDEALGILGPDPERVAVVETTLQARHTVQEARRRQKDRYREDLERKLAADPFKWPCGVCYIDNQDLFNFAEVTRCYKCSRAKPKMNDAAYEHTRWKCSQCSTDSFTISGMFKKCPGCQEVFDFSQEWWTIASYEPEPESTTGSEGETRGSAGAADRRKKPRKRGGKKHKKWPAQPSASSEQPAPSAAQQSRAPRVQPAADADERFRRHEETSSDEEEVNYKKRRFGLTSKGRRCVPPAVLPGAVGIGGVILLNLPGQVSAMPPDAATASLSVLAALTTAGLFTIKRTYYAVDNVIEAVEHQAIEFVEAIGYEYVKFAPLLVGVFVTLLLVFLKFVVTKYWTGSKEKLKQAGENPEGNVENAERVNFPYVPWLSKDLVSRVVANIDGAFALADEVNSIVRVEDSMHSFNWQVKSQSGRAKPYLVRMNRRSMLTLVTPVRDMISCGCPGHACTLEKQGLDRLCKHCGAIMLLCLRAHRAAPVASVSSLPSASATAQVLAHCPARGRTMSGGRATIQLPVEDQPQPEDRVCKHVGALLSRGSQSAILHEKVETRSRRSVSPKKRIDTQLSAPSVQPAASAVSAKSLPTGTRKPTVPCALFSGYDETAEDASALMLNGGGTLVSLMSGKQTQKMGVYLLSKATFRSVLTAFTFDLDIITEASKEAARRGVDMTVIGDHRHTISGSTKAMVAKFSEMRDAGVKVLLSRGISGSSGIQHSKTLLCDEHVIVGSCNWTNSSRLNQERSVLIALNEKGMQAYEESLKHLKAYCSVFSEKDEEHGQAVRARRASRSIPPTATAKDRYTTAKRFSVARARSLGPDAATDV